MKISEQWLREWVNPALDFATIGHKLTMAGCEVEGEEGVASSFSDVVVGEITAAEQHPDADRLRVCTVQAGDEEPLQIVCGAPNARVGLKAPVARIGATLPLPDSEKPLKIKKGKLRGVASFGMLCSAEELGLAEKAEGLLELAMDAPVGVALRDYLQLDDRVLELNITPERGDCLSVAGVAREVGVLTQSALTPPEITTQPVVQDECLSVSLPAPDACPRYAGRIIRNINPQAPSPQWLQEKLRRLGVRSLSAIVDVTNYVLLELGQPMHAFDLDALRGGIQARYAQAGERLKLLNEQVVDLQENTLVIADEQQALALAGIMGGAASAVTDHTQHIFLESAHFRPEYSMGKARQYGLQTDSSYRFERGVSPDLCVEALERATQLIVSICGGEVGEVEDVLADPILLEAPSITLRRERIPRVLGMSIADTIVTDSLQRLGCDVSETAVGWQVKPPLARFDLRIEEDLIEEVARIHGYDQIPTVLRRLQPRVVLPSETQLRLAELRAPLLAGGYQEAVTYSFVHPKMEDLLMPGRAEIRLANPISNDLSRMRSTIWSGLLPAVAHNLNRQQSRVRLFEVGPIFTLLDGHVEQRQQLAGAVSGTVAPEQWSLPSRSVDFYDIKGDVENILARANTGDYHFLPMAHPALHPGQSAQIVRDHETVGWLGALHPRIEAELDLEQSVYLFELNMSALQQRHLPRYQPVTRFPAIRRDLALVVDQTVLASSLDTAIRAVATDQLISWRIFDVYTGKGVEAHQKSVAISLILQDLSRTLEDGEVNQILESVVTSLHAQTGATLR